MNLIQQFELSVARMVLSVFSAENHTFTRCQAITWLRGEAHDPLAAMPAQDSCFGLLENYSPGQIEEVIDLLLVEGLLHHPQGSGYEDQPLRPTDRGYEMIEGKLHPQLSVSGLFEKRNIHDFGHREMVLYKTLQNLRARLAYETHQQPYQICYDSLLRSLCCQMPSTKHELLSVEGITPKFVECYGHAFLQLLQTELVAA